MSAPRKPCARHEPTHVSIGGTDVRARADELARRRIDSRRRLRSSSGTSSSHCRPARAGRRRRIDDVVVVERCSAAVRLAPSLELVDPVAAPADEHRDDLSGRSRVLGRPRVHPDVPRTRSAWSGSRRGSRRHRTTPLVARSRAPARGLVPVERFAVDPEVAAAVADRRRGPGDPATRLDQRHRGCSIGRVAPELLGPERPSQVEWRRSPGISHAS